MNGTIKSTQTVLPPINNGNQLLGINNVNNYNIKNINNNNESIIKLKTQNDFKTPLNPNIDFSSNENGENIKVCVRIRPMNLQEQGRGDKNNIEIKGKDRLIFINRNLRRAYNYDMVFGPESKQEDIFFNCSINKLIDSALDGYSVTIFAYGQTGSGKTYTIMGREDSINENILTNDDYTGIMPKSIKYIWNTVSNREEKYFIKVSFLEIYNEQIKDLLNTGESNLQIRWDQKQGFFVEGLLVIECKRPEDIVEVILEGNRNRKKGAHELNKDSSRSHCILTLYIISEYSDGSGVPIKRYGKISFVDLAGSERLKESKSQGAMIKETGNINKSLFVLGKVISALTDKKSLKGYSHIPYRDSKLTMLLMDSLGGSSKTLMIACVNPSSVYGDETMSTLNYASRTMNIQNKPSVQMDGKIKSTEALKAQNSMFKLQNEFYKNQFIKLLGMVPSLESGGLTEEDIAKFKEKNGYKTDEETDKEIKSLQSENEDLKTNSEKNERQKVNLANENAILTAKINNLERIYIGSDIIRHQDGSCSNNIDGNYNLSSVLLENQELKKTLDKLEIDKLELRDAVIKSQNHYKSEHTGNIELENIKEQNAKLTRKIEFLQQRESELLNTIMKLKSGSKNNSE